MTPAGDRWRRVVDAFDALAELSGSARADRLERLAAESPETHAEVVELLRHADEPEPLTAAMARVVIGAAAEADDADREAAGEADPLLGAEIGQYRILERLGAGGFGTVYRARQHEPVQREVALKVLRDAASGPVAERFELERQSLARMSHPAIAQVYDAGTLPDGRAYFAMELVEGTAITDSCRRRRSTVEERLRLLQQVCGAVQHAHQRGILHRDLKPSNILVTEIDGEARPKVIDFGIAKALRPEPAARALTQIRQVIGTLEYMSPEQARFDAGDVDTRSDVYSLGVVLYELLTGETPLRRARLAEATLDEALRLVRESEVDRPSTRASALSRDPSASAGGAAEATGAAATAAAPALPRRLRGDLDWITLKALEKDRDRRYESPSALAADLARHLRNEPVEAGPPSRRYRWGRFVRRHRVAVAASAAVLSALLVGLVVSYVSLRRVAVERDRALRAEARTALEAESARRVSDFVEELFLEVDPAYALGREVTAREIFERGGERVEGLVEREPLLAARLLAVIGRVRAALGLYASAEEPLRRAAEIRSRLGAEEGAQIDDGLALAELWMLQNRLDEAQRQTRRVLEERRERFGPRSAAAAEAIALLGEIGFRQSDTGHVEHVEEALAIRRETLGDRHPDVAESLAALGRNAGWFNRWDEAATHYEEAATLLEATLDPLHPRALATRLEQVRALAHLHRAEEGLELADRVVARVRRAFGADHPAHGEAIAARGSVHYRATKDQEAALADFEAALEILRETWDEDHPRVTEVRRRRGFALMALERYAEALEVQFEILATERRTLGPRHNRVMRQHFNIGDTAQRMGDHRLAAEHLRRHLTFVEGKDWKSDVLYARPMNLLAKSLMELGELAEAEELLLTAHRLLLEEYNEEFFAVAIQRRDLVALYERWRRPEEAERWRAALERASAAADDEGPAEG